MSPKTVGRISLQDWSLATLYQKFAYPSDTSYTRLGALEGRLFFSSWFLPHAAQDTDGFQHILNEGTVERRDRPKASLYLHLCYLK